MKRLWPALAFAAWCVFAVSAPAAAQTCAIGGHNETSENFTAAGGWTTANMSPGVVPPGVTGTHLLISEVAVRGAGTGAASDSSEYIEIYNPTAMPVSMDDKYISDDIGYYRIVNGPYPVVNTSDYALKFPNGLLLAPGRTIILCVTKAGFAGSGASPGPAQYFLEMKDSNGIAADDMVNVATGSAFPVTGGMLTNASTTNGEWVVLFCWNGSSDLVCDIDYASWGANSASNPKMDKSGIVMDGPDAGAATSAYNADTPAATQTNLGTAALVKPNTYQRFGSEVGETPLGGNGCIGKVILTSVSWVPVPNPAGGPPNIRFHLQWQNPDPDAPSTQFAGQVFAQDFGVFQPDLGLLDQFNVPPLQPNSFFDVFFEIPLDQLPPPPQKIVPGGGGAGATIGLASAGAHPVANFDCPPDTNWAGNVDIMWSGPGQGGQVNKHYSDIRTCAGGAPSYIHFRGSNCPSPMPWTVSGLCPGFTATLVNEDFTPAPNPVPVGWTGWIQIQAAAAVPSGTPCCFSLTFVCDGAASTMDICTTACDCGVNPPTLSVVDWKPIGPGAIRFHQRWTNPDPTRATDPVSGNMKSQPFGVFQPSPQTIGPFSVPPIQPNSFFDVFIDVPLAQLPPPPAKIFPGSGGGAAMQIASAGGGIRTNIDCPPDTNWAGNVDIQWTGGAAGFTGHVNKHYADLQTCAGGAPSYIHFRPSNCGVPMPWSVVAPVCPGFSVTMVNEDFTPAPNPLPVGWSGWIQLQAGAGVAPGTPCCVSIVFTCDGVPSTIDICTTACDCGHNQPTLSSIDWTTLPGDIVRFHQHWTNPSATSPTEPVHGSMNSQKFGVFLPNYGPIGDFDVPAITIGGFFDVFIDIARSSLPANPPVTVPGGNPPAGTPCYVEDHWHGNVNVDWAGPGGPASIGKHFGEMPICPGGPPTTLFVETGCTSALGASWSITGLCPGWSATLLNTDSTPAPNPVPPGWVGLIAVSAAPGTPIGSVCCFTVNFLCDGAPAVIDVCAKACACQHPQPHLDVTDWALNGANVRFHMRWSNPGQLDSDPIGGTIKSQPFGAFVPDAGDIGPFNVPPLAPSSFFDVFVEVPLASLPAQPQKILPGGGPHAIATKGAQTEAECPPDTSWSGNVDIQWNDPAGGGGQVNRHFTDLLVNPGVGSSHVHTLIFCNSPIGASWSIAGVCPGWHVALLNEDFTPAPNPVPPGWTGWISVAADAGVLPGSSCCFSVTFVCDGVPGTIDVCAEACAWNVATGVIPNPLGVSFGILRTAPNPTSGDMAITFVVPRTGNVTVGIYNLAGRLVRTLVSGTVDAGQTTVRWDGKADGGVQLAPGAYFVKIDDGAQRTTRKLLITR